MTKTLTIKDVEQLLLQIDHEDDPRFISLQNDERKGVQRLIDKWKKERAKQEAEKQRLEEMTQFERQLRQEGFTLIAGVDEVGRGPLAGPVVAAAVILPPSSFLPGLNDSKKLSEKKRNELFEMIKQQAISIGIGVISAEEIDQINIYQAAKKAMIHAVQQLSPFPEFLLIDAMEVDAPIPQQSLIKGDEKSLSIAAASVVAKVTRDRMMREWGKQYPAYGFEKNMGYGTKEHLEALKQLGPCPIHRKTFSPVKDYIR
jgi:ribonuclease HII